MGKYSTLRDEILTAGSDANLGFADVCNLLKKPEFDERIKGDRHIFTRVDIAEIINVQSKGNEAKASQVKQIRNIIVKYKLGECDVD